ncbi:membrane-spanning 4-domains subfamily A member 4A-like isoform X1 [Brachyhypopomus gauderio]|uniref:membrane-spanning 4-domains subfamily A member 4A-like isoform X1 n=1 Tax=Brachyhypopomus gauderio TaxID=698409 RepID=UPI0040429E21
MSTTVPDQTVWNVITQILPQHTVLSTSGTTRSIATPLKKFLKGKPKALGIVQVMVGVISFQLFIVLSSVEYGVFLQSGFLIWGPLIYLIAGIISIIAESKPSSGMVKASIAVNVISAVTAGIGIIMLAMDLASSQFSYYTWNYTCGIYYFENTYRLKYGIEGVLILLTVFQFIISLCIAGFGCNAVCWTETVVPEVHIYATASSVSTANINTNKPDISGEPIYDDVDSSSPELP